MKKLLLLFAIFSIQCAGGGNHSQTLDKANLKFQAGDYAAALLVYVDLISTEGSNARVGAGWCELLLNDYESASSYFSDASDDSLVDGYAGWAFVLWAQNKPGEVISKIDWVLSIEPQYQFSLDERIGANQLIWLQASSYLQIGNYAQCLLWIQKLDPAFSVNINDTANVSGLLLSKLQSLGNAVNL
ncbi:hypothetical protein JNL27_15070 [bacterium]|nr:hypothetical protein [bacterium]